MFVKSAEFYDAIYSWKDYQAEAQTVHAIIQQHKRSSSSRLLDVACGTGAHMAHLRQYYAVEGLDMDEGLLGIARRRLPGITFHKADMTDFRLDRQYDAVTCLFSSIGYAQTVDALNRTLVNLARCALPGGVVLVEPWFHPGAMTEGGIHGKFVDEPALKIARLNVTEFVDSLSILHFHYLVGTPEGISYFTEDHVMGLFTDEQYREAFTRAGLEVTYDAEGLMGRGLYIGLHKS